MDGNGDYGGARPALGSDSNFEDGSSQPASEMSKMGVGTADDNLQLEQMGYKQELYRGFDGFMSFAFCFTAVSVIPSISLGFTSEVGVGGPAEIVWSWLVGSTFCVIAGLSMAEIASVYPSAGSVYHWAGQMGPPEWAPISSYICGWFNFLGNAAGDAAFSSGFATCVGYALAIANPDTDGLTVGQQVGVSIAVLAMWAIIDISRTDFQGWINNLAVFVQIGGSVSIVIALLVLAPERATGSYVFLEGYDLVNVTGNTYETYPGMPVSAYTVIIGITNCLFAFTGYEAGAHMAEETRDARTAAPRGIMGTVLCCASFGLLYILGMLFATPDITALETPVQDIYQTAAGQQGGLALMIILIIIFFFAGISSTTVTSRIVFALARDDALPLSSWIKPVVRRTHAPFRSVMVVFMVDSLFMLLPLINSSALAAITGTCTVGYQISYAIPIILRCTVGRSRWRPGVWNLGRLSLPCAVITASWQVMSSALFFLPFGFPVTTLNMNWTVVVVSGVAFIAAANWALSARFAFRGPKRVDEIEAKLAPELALAPQPEAPVEANA